MNNNTMAAPIPEASNRGLYNLLMYGMAMPYIWPDLMYRAYVQPLTNMQPNLMPVEEAQDLSQTYDPAYYPPGRSGYWNYVRRQQRENDIEKRRSLEKRGVILKDPADDVARFYGY